MMIQLRLADEQNGRAIIFSFAWMISDVNVGIRLKFTGSPDSDFTAQIQATRSEVAAYAWFSIGKGIEVVLSRTHLCIACGLSADKVSER